MFEYEVGDKIVYEPFGGGLRTVTVTAKDDDIKNGEPGFDGVSTVTDDMVWGYDSQIVRVLS